MCAPRGPICGSRNRESFYDPAVIASLNVRVTWPSVLNQPAHESWKILPAETTTRLLLVSRIDSRAAVSLSFNFASIVEFRHAREMGSSDSRIAAVNGEVEITHPKTRYFWARNFSAEKKESRGDREREREGSASKFVELGGSGPGGGNSEENFSHNKTNDAPSRM